MREPSADYQRALQECQQHHASSKTFSGRLLRPHAPFIKAIIDRLGCTSILDFGCGKGLQYEWVSHGDDASIPAGQTLETYWGVPVTKYDPAYPPFAAEPVGTFDLVLCTHTLGSIPKADLPWVIDRLHALANKGLYVAEKLGPVHKTVVSQPELFPRGWTHAQWKAAIKRRNGLEVTLSTRRSDPRLGTVVKRERL
jgi:SAM-dependent methyltransferase